MAAVFPGAVSTQAQLRVLVNNRSTLLNGDHTSGVTTITVDDTTSFPTSGYATIDSEVFLYTGVTATTFTGVTRGSDGTTAVAHSDNATVNHYFIADHHNHMADEVIAIQQNLSNRVGLSASQLLVPAGDFSLPPYGFSGAAGLGWYRSAAQEMSAGIAAVQNIAFAANSFRFGSSLTVVLGASLQFRTATADGSGNTNIAVVNDLNSGSGNALFLAQVGGGTTTGDPHTRYIVLGVTTWATGIDNSDSDSFVIANNATPGTNNYLKIDTSGNLTITTDITCTGAGKGYVCTTPDGTATYRVFVDNTGAISTIQIS